MSDANDTRDLAARIEDALRGTTPGEWDWYVDGVGDIQGSCYEWLHNSLDDYDAGTDGYGPRITATNRDAELHAAAPSLLRDALARIDADAARIEALEGQLWTAKRETEAGDDAIDALRERVAYLTLANDTLRAAPETPPRDDETRGAE